MKPRPFILRTRRWPLFFAALTAATGMFLSLHIRNRIAQTEATEVRLTAETLRLNTEQELNLFADVLESVGALHALSDAVNQEAMTEFIEKGMVHQHAILGPFGLTQRIGPWLRNQVESKEGNQPGAYKVVQSGPEGRWIPAETKPVYYPLTWQSRPNGLNVPIGFDFSSVGAEALQTIQKIERSRRPALVPAPNPLSKTDTPSYWTFAPVIPRQIKSSNLTIFGNVIGFAVAELHPESILKQVASLSAQPADLQLNLTVSTQSDPSETIERAGNMWQYTHPLEAIDTQWIFECRLPRSASGRHATAALIFGLLITALVVSQLLILATRTRKIELEVRNRTDELNRAKNQLEATLEERAQLEQELHELTAKERRKIGRDLHDSLGQNLTGAVFLSRSLLNWFQKAETRDQRSEDRGQRSEVGGQKAEDRGQRSEVGGQKAEDRGQRSEVGGQKAEDRGQRSEVGRQKTEVGGQKTEDRERESALATQSSHAQTLNETLKTAVAQVRSMARGLSPVTLNDESLPESFKELAEEMTNLYAVPCSVTNCAEIADLDSKTKEQLYLIAREAINNAARHAKAAEITLQFEQIGSGWKLTVQDNGTGLSEPDADSTGMGIRIMRHRAGLIGAEFSIHSAPDHGTQITVSAQQPT